MGRYYPDIYDCYEDVNSDPKTTGLLKRAYHYGLDKRSGFVTHYKQSGRLLDIGCASGVFLNHFRQKTDWEVTGLEINAGAAEYARKHYGLNVKTGTLEDRFFPADYFDAVTLWDVLEHLHDPVASLKEIHRILKPGGIVVFRVPNGKSWDAQFFGPYWVGLEAPRHLFIYDPHSVSKLLQKSGFQCLHQTTRGAGYLTFILSIGYWRSAQALKKGRKISKKNLFTNLLNHPIARILSAPIFYLPGAFHKGAMLTVTAVKMPAEGRK